MNNWKKVSEKPLVDGDYLVYDGGACCMIAEFIGGECVEVFSDFWKVSEVTHWMELPELPKY